jgi:hypothetical protein
MASTLGIQDRHGRLWLLLALSIGVHLYFLIMIAPIKWSVATITNTPNALEIVLFDAPPARMRNDQGKLEQHPISKAIDKKRAAPILPQPSPDKSIDREAPHPLPGVSIPSESSATPPHEPDTQHETSGIASSSGTLNAASLIEKSLTMVHKDPSLSAEEEDDFNKHFMMKRTERIRQMLPALMDQPQLQKNERVEIFTTVNGDARVTLAMGNGKRVCFEIPKRDLSTPDLQNSPALWKFTQCKSDTGDQGLR